MNISNTARNFKRPTRRSLLAALPAAAASTALAAHGAHVSGAADQTPIMQKLHEWQAHYQWMEGLGDLPDEAFNEVCADNIAMANEIADMRSEGPMDVLAKILAFSQNGEEFLEDGQQRGKRILGEVRAVLAA